MINKISNKGIKQLIRISFMFDNFSKLTNYSKINVKVRSEANYKGLIIEGLTKEKVIQSIIHKFSQNFSPDQIHLNDDNSIQLDLKTNTENFL